MFKPIPGNNKYVISLTQDIRYLDGSKVDIPIIDNKISIELYNVFKIVDLKWLSLIANFETLLPFSNAKDLFNINFTDANISFFRPVSGKIMVFKRPVILNRNNKIYRVIPCFTRYAVSMDGEIIEISSNNIIKIVNDLKRHNVIEVYPSVYIYNPERSSYKYVLLHRLVALAWIVNPNDDFMLRPIVNHKDGNKKNFYYKNLEWCSFSENNFHAVNIGLKTDNICCKVRDFNTGIVRDFSSLAQANCFMGLNEKSIRTNSLCQVKSRLINNRYELKIANDDSPWFYENKSEKVKIGRYIITVTDLTNKIEYFNDLRDFKDKFKIWNCPKIIDIINRAKAENLGYKFEVTDNYHSEVIQAFDIKNKVITETKTIVEMSKALSIPEHLIRRCLNNSETRVKNGYAFRYKTDSVWDTNFVEHEKKHTRLLVINQKTKEEHYFESIRSAAKILKVDRTSIKNSLINGILLNDYLITEIKE